MQIKSKRMSLVHFCRFAYIQNLFKSVTFSKGVEYFFKLTVEIKIMPFPI